MVARTSVSCWLDWRCVMIQSERAIEMPELSSSWYSVDGWNQIVIRVEQHGS